MEFCNPLDLEYKFQHYGQAAHREAADPTLILFKGVYYLFAGMSAGFYHSDELAHWKWHENRSLDIYLYAPDARQIGEYLYWGSSNDRPICGVELDPQTMTPIGERKSLIWGDRHHHGFERFSFPGKKEKESTGVEKTLFDLFFGSGEPFMEGSYMNKLRGRYYLQYAAPATRSPSAATATSWAIRHWGLLPTG